jgi:ankyrin repeat protein
LQSLIWDEEIDDAKELIELGDLNRVNKPGGQSALHVAVQMRNLEIVELLLAKGIDTGIVDDGNATARHLAEESGQKEIAGKIKEAELRQNYDIPRRTTEEIVMGTDEDGRLVFGYKWAKIT